MCFAQNTIMSASTVPMSDRVNLGVTIRELEEPRQCWRPFPRGEFLDGRYSLDDEAARLIGDALPRASYLKSIIARLRTELTVIGAKAFADGVRRSNITKLVIHRKSREFFLDDDAFLRHKNDRPNVDALRILFVESRVDNVEFEDQLIDDNVNDLKAILTADDNIMISWPRKLEIAIGADMTISGARQLSEIFLQPRIEDVTINQAFNESNPLVMRAIVLSAVASITHFALTWHLLSDDDVVLLGAALDGNTTLRSLKFYVANWSLPAVTSLAQGIGKSQISTLRLHGSIDTRHDADDVEALQISLPAQEILFDQGVRLSQTIHHLTVRYYMHAIPNALVRCVPRLQTLNVSPEGEMIDATRLAHSLREATQLSSLKIDLYLEKSDVYLVCEALPQLPLLESLGLSCDLASYENGDTDFRGMFSDLESSDVGAFGAERLMVAVVNHPRIVKLSLARSYDIGFKGLDTIGRPFEDKS